MFVSLRLNRKIKVPRFNLLTKIRSRLFLWLYRGYLSKMFVNTNEAVIVASDLYFIYKGNLVSLSALLERYFQDIEQKCEYANNQSEKRK